MPEFTSNSAGTASASTQTSSLSVSRAASRRPGRKQWIRLGLGVVAGLIAIDVALYPIVATWYWPKGPVRTSRVYVEGIGESHFVPDGIGTYGHRMTGNPEIPGAPTVMILGDSHIVQDGVDDDETVGSALERYARAAGKPVNVKQYGWYETAAPTFIAEAPELLKRIQPKKVVVLLNFTDISGEVFTGQYWQMRLNPDGSFRLIDVRPPKVQDIEKVTLRDMAAMSRLVVSVRRRMMRIFEAQAAPKSNEKVSDFAAVTRASVRGLKEAYGDKLLIIFAAACGPRCTETLEPSEAELLEACRAESTSCVSTHPEALQELREHRRLTRGFHNTAPGVGHLNPVGLDVAGRIIWREIAGSL